MKKLPLIVLLGILVFAPFTGAKAQQQVTIDLQVFGNLPEVDFAAFAVIEDLEGAPRIMQITMTPQNVMVYVEGALEWKKPGSSIFERLFFFKTKPFLSRNFSNEEIGNTDIKIDDSDSPNDDLADENLKRGKPTGTYRITLQVFSPDGTFLSQDMEELDFSNPTQTIAITSPQANTSYDIGSVLATWTEVPGVEGYEITANVRKRSRQSLEEALAFGTPIIDKVNIGNVTMANLRQYLSREWLPGQEIVFQVAAIIPRPGGNERLYSDIVNFRLKTDDTGELNKDMLNLLSNVEFDLSKLTQTGGSLKGDKRRIRQILTMLSNGEIDLSNVRITTGEGAVLTEAEVKAIINYLQNNPRSVVNMRFIED